MRVQANTVAPSRVVFSVEGTEFERLSDAKKHVAEYGGVIRTMRKVADGE